MAYYYHAKKWKNCKNGFQDMPKTVKIWLFDLVPRANQSFQDIEIWVILKASIASKILPTIKKKSNETLLRYFQKSQFLCSKWAKNGAWGRGCVFFKNPACHFWVFMMTKHHAKY